MTSDVRRTLASIGIQAEKRKKHWILRYGNKIFICPSSASDHRSGMNLALEICRTLSEVQEKETKTFDNEQLLAMHCTKIIRLVIGFPAGEYKRKM